MALIKGFRNHYSGLSAAEVSASLQQFGFNELAPEQSGSFLKKIWSTCTEPMFLLLFGAAAIYFILGEHQDALIMLGFVLFIAGINLFQEWRTDKTLHALRALSAPKTTVIRDGSLLAIDSRELAVGDLMLLEEGERVNADGKIIEMFDLGMDESALTGESDTVWKKTAPAEQNEHWQPNFCYAGTAVVQGSAIVQIEKIGMGTEYGKISQSLLEVTPEKTPLEKQTRKLIKICAAAGFFLFILVLLANYVHNAGFVNSLLAGITLAMAIIPEEFPVILTVFLAMGAWRLARKQTLIRRMPSVETLGAVSVLCVDKTGTLTENRMTVQNLAPFDSVSTNDLLHWATLASETEPYDPMEKAILAKTEAAGITPQQIFVHKLVFEYPFNNSSKMMGHVWEINGRPALAAKGSPESILPLCRLTPDAAQAVAMQQQEMAQAGLRVIAVAQRTEMTEIPAELGANQLRLLGLIGLADPPREAVPEAIRRCGQAGIRVIMITGDNGITAAAIAKKIGLSNAATIITGKELEAMPEAELNKKIKTVNIFARVIPQQKMRIVKALQAGGAIVAMTGDGVNDAPALKLADIGIAMGKRGTNVAREAADMILLDDNFTTIVETVKDGRRIYDNIKKAVGYVFVVHIPIALMALLPPLLHLPMLLLPVHVVLLELIIDPTCSIVFERQPPDKDIMSRPPRSASTGLISAGMMLKAALQGLTIFAVAFSGCLYLDNNGYSIEVIRTFLLLVLAFSNLFLAFINQSEQRSFISSLRLILTDKVVILINLVILFVLVVIVYLPAGNALAATTALKPGQIAVIIGLALAATLWWEIVKLFRWMLTRQK